jgi:hypothetical protein
MHKKNKIKQNIHLNLIVIFLLIIFLIKTDFFKKLYYLNQDNYTKRMVDQYGYCSKDSYGFLVDLKKKYEFHVNPKIINYDVLPSSNWIIYNSFQDFEENPRIFLNYQKEPSLIFKIFNNSEKNFKSEGHVQYTNFLESITFKTKNENFYINDNIKIYKIVSGEKKLIFKKYINENIENQKKIYTNFKTELFNSRWEQFYFELDNTKHSNKIDKVTLNFRNKYQFSDEDVLFSKENCFYIK